MVEAPQPHADDTTAHADTHAVPADIDHHSEPEVHTHAAAHAAYAGSDEAHHAAHAAELHAAPDSVSHDHEPTVSDDDSEGDPAEQAEHRQNRAQVRALVQAFQAIAGQWAAQLIAAGTHAVQGIQSTASHEQLAIDQHAEQHGATIRTHFAAQRAATAQAITQHRQALRASAQRESQTIRAHATEQSAKVAQDATVAQTSVGQAATTHATAVTATGSSQSARVYSVLGAQSANIAARGSAAAGSYGGGDNGHAQGAAAQQVAGKGQSAISHPGPAIAGDVTSAATFSSQRITQTSTGVNAQIASRVPGAKQRMQGGAQRATAGIQKMAQGGDQHLAATNVQVAAGLHRKEAESLAALRRQASRMSAALTTASAHHQREVHGTAQDAAGRLRTATAALAKAASGARDPQAVAGALERARGQIGTNIAQLSARMTTGETGFRTRAAQQGAATRQHLAQGTQAAQHQASQVTAETTTAAAQLSARGQAHAAQGSAQATQGLTQQATQAQTQNQQTAQTAAAHFTLAAAQTTAQLGSSVDQGTAQNQTHVGGQVDRGMGKAAAEVGADHDESLLDKIVDFFKAAWDWVSSVAKAVASIAIDFLIYLGGAVLQIVSDCLGGVLDPLLDWVPSETFQRGRDFGDIVFAVVGGILLIIGGIAALGGGVAISLVEIAGSGGLLIPVVVVQDAALATVGVGAIAAGIALLSTTGSRPKKSGPWTCYGRSAVLQIPRALPEHVCPLDGQYVDGPSVSGPTEAAACLAAKHAFNAMMPRGCRPKHLACRCTKR